MSDQQSYKAAFFIVPARILDLPGLTLQLLRFYETIFQFWNHGKDCFLTNSILKERTGMKSISTIIDAFAFFEKAGEMKRYTSRDGRRYIVQTLSIQEPQDDDEGVSPQREGGIAAAIGGVSPQRYHNKKKINTKKENKNFCASDDARAQIDQKKATDDFEDFWKIYPNKKDKARARKRWEKLKQQDRVLILAKLKEQVAKDVQFQGDPQYIPLPSTYLHGRRWEDEIRTGGKVTTPAIGYNHRNEVRSTVPWVGGCDPKDRLTSQGGLSNADRSTAVSIAR